jgi:hypothetical protein
MDRKDASILTRKIIMGQPLVEAVSADSALLPAD